MRNRSCLEALEQRRLLAVNLTAQPDASTAPNVVLPGGTFVLPVQIGNDGTDPTSTSFAVGARFVPISVPQWFAQTAAYAGAGFINVGSATHTGAVPASSTSASVSVTINVPSNIPAGLYALVVKADTNNTVAESNETDNEARVLAIAALSSAGVMSLNYADSVDSIRMALATADGKKAVRFKSEEGSLTFRTGAVSGFNIRMLGGDDTVIVDGLFAGVIIDAGDGNDRVAGHDGNETLIGGAGKDVLDGGGNDRLNGNGGNDKLLGNAGADRLYGYDGQDYLDGGSSGDRLEGGGGLDTLLGQSGDDKFFAADNAIDQLFGASGSDSASADPEDVLSSVESAVIID